MDQPNMTYLTSYKGQKWISEQMANLDKQKKQE
jgi:hypothetical protein